MELFKRFRMMEVENDSLTLTTVTQTLNTFGKTYQIALKYDGTAWVINYCMNRGQFLELRKKISLLCDGTQVKHF